jgi:cation diffusion facilitator family transporter
MNKNKQKIGYIEASLSAIINIALFILKLWAGFSIGSVAIIADAWHTLSDTFTSGLILISFWFAGKPKDENHPFGHGRAELICAIIIATILVLVGINFIKDAIGALITHKSVEYSKLALIIMAISVLFKEALAQFSFWAGKKINSKSLLADGWHHRSDAITSIIIIIGFFLGKYFWWIDGVLGLLVSTVIIYSAYIILKDTTNSILGNCIDKKLEKDINSIVDKINKKSKPHHMHMHCYGDHIEVTFHLTFPASYSLKDAHDIATKIENEIRNKINIEATIHLEPE